MMIASTVMTVVLSVGVGLCMGVIGGGGGGFYVFVLMLFLHQNAKTAAVTALVLSTITLSGASWQYWRKKTVQKEYFAILTVLAIIGTVAGNRLLSVIGETAIRILMCCVLVFSAVASLLKLRSQGLGENPKPVRKKLPVLLPVGLAGGLITGTTGLSGGTMLSSFLIGLMDFPPIYAVGTTTVVGFVGNVVSIAALAAFGAARHVNTLNLDPEILLTFGIGSAAGAVLGARVAVHVNNKALTVLLAIVAIVPGIYFVVSR